MPNSNFTVNQVADCLGVDARKVERMAAKGELPGEFVTGSWRFNRMRFGDWLHRNAHTLDSQRLARLEEVLRLVPGDATEAAPAGNGVILGLLRANAIAMELPARTKDSVLRKLVGLAEGTGLLYDAEGLLDSLRKREEACSTAIPGGIAIPHPMRPMPYATAEPMICFGRVRAGVGFGDPDGELTYLFFLICCHDHRHHLTVLARLMRILDTDTIAALRNSSDARDALLLLDQRERDMPGRG